MLRNKLAYFILLSIPMLNGCTDSNNDQIKVYVTSQSDTGTLQATIRIGTSDNLVYLSIKNTERSSVITTKELHIPSSYHAPIISMAWKGEKILRITVDHDFGEGNHVYEYNADTDTLKML